MHELLARSGVPLLDEFTGQWWRRGSGRVGTRDRQRAAPGRPVVVDLADHQLRGAFRRDAPFEGAVLGDVEGPVVERGFAVRHVGVGVFTAEHLETQICGGAPGSGHDVLVPGLHAGAEIQRVGIVEAHLVERTGAGQEERVVAVVVERHVRTGRDPTCQVLQAFEQVGFGFDVRRLADQALSLGYGVDQWL